MLKAVSDWDALKGRITWKCVICNMSFDSPKLSEFCWKHFFDTESALRYKHIFKAQVFNGVHAENAEVEPL